MKDFLTRVLFGFLGAAMVFGFAWVTLHVWPGASLTDRAQVVAPWWALAMIYELKWESFERKMADVD